MKILATRLVIAALLVLTIVRAGAADYQVIDVPAGQSSDVFYQINTKGTVYLKIVAEGGQEPCADFWWIKWGLGTIEKLGRRCGLFSLPIPGLFEGSVSAKLRTGGAPYRLKILVTADESVAHSTTVRF